MSVARVLALAPGTPIVLDADLDVMGSGHVRSRELRLVVDAFLPLFSRGIPGRAAVRRGQECINTLVDKGAVQRGICSRRRRIPLRREWKIVCGRGRRARWTATSPVEFRKG